MSADTCFACRWLVQGSDGSNGCIKFGEPGYPQEPTHLDDPPTPLYDDCHEVTHGS